VPTQLASTEINPALMALVGRPRTMLDVGCGAGIHSLFACRAGARVTGIEGNRELATQAGRLLDEVHECDPGDAAAVTRALGERRFDLIVMPDILERSLNPEAVVQLFTRYLLPEGRLIASAKTSQAWPVRLRLDRPSIGYHTAEGGMPRLLAQDELRHIVSGAGLQVLEVEHTPMLLKALRAVLSPSDPTGFRDWSPYQAYLSLVRPLETKLAESMGEVMIFQNVIVARKRPDPGPLSLTVGMLTMDEEESIARMIDEIRRRAPDAKLLIVDSSLKDKTPIIAEQMGARVLRQLPPRGHGPAMELLMTEASKESEALIYLDCDFTYPPAMIPAIRRILESGADVVNAARIRDKPAAMPLPNYLANKTFAVCAKLLNGVPVADLHSGMRGYRSSLTRAFSFDGEGDALPIDTLLWPARSGYRVVEVPIDYQDRVGTSKLRKVAGTVWTFIRLGKTLGVGSRRGGQYEVWPDVEGPES
jgi:hypothetical protein